ncbi:MAG: anhydro-N-acetylmuramic acid kinase [Terriglobales bacterium]
MTMIVAGVMSGTSADGINVALVRFATEPTAKPKNPSRHKNHRATFTLLAHEEYPFPAPVRRAILGMMNAELAPVADLARLNFLLGELYAEAVAKTARKHRVKLDLIGCHGQTLYHQGTPQRFLGRKLAVTWQTGEAAVIASRLGVPVISDFRPADMAAGGKGAPLVPFFDYVLYRDPDTSRIAQNIGGIANLTAIPAGASLGNIIAFDTGPGNMVIDAAMEELFGKRYDRDGKIAASGHVLDHVVAKLLRKPFFRQRPPRTAGREEFGREYLGRFLRLCRGASKPDLVATATALTALSIADAVQRFVLPNFVGVAKLRRGGKTAHQMIVSGGGAKNPTLITMLREAVAPLGISLHFSDEFGVPAEAKEAVAFALLAHETWHRRASNVPSATGAKRPTILGKISYA